MKEKEQYCLVLSGGGAKGVYHIGAWRALRKCGVRVNAFIGNSIGALIAGFLAQGKEKVLDTIVQNIGIDFILDLPEELVHNGELSLNKASFSTFKKFYQTTIERGGLDTSPLRRLILDNLDDRAIRKKGNDLGVVTYNLSDRKPREVFIEEMEPGTIPDYLMASAAFPGFQSAEIAGKNYIDGGVYDNIPYSMARRRGYRRIIVIDISGIGMRQKLQIEGGCTIYIKNSIDMGGVLDFNKKFINDYCELGYLDTLKTFARLKGNSYFLLPNERAEKSFATLLGERRVRQRIIDLASRLYGRVPATYHESLRSILPEHSKFHTDLLPVFADSAASVLRLERIRQWSYQDCLNEIERTQRELLHSVKNSDDNSPKKIEEIIRRRLSGKGPVNSPYYYYLIIDTFLSGKLQQLLVKSLCEAIPELACGIVMMQLLVETQKALQ